MIAPEVIRARIGRLAELKAAYLAYLHHRIAEEDWHGAWDGCINLSELSCEKDGLDLALRALGEGGPVFEVEVVAEWQPTYQIKTEQAP